MKNLFSILMLAFLITGFQLQAQTAGETEKSANSKTITLDTEQAAVKCHGGASKAGCCASKEAASAKKSKKKSKDAASCCAASSGAKCCAHAKDGEHAEKPCHPGCTMPCCAKKE